MNQKNSSVEQEIRIQKIAKSIFNKYKKEELSIEELKRVTRLVNNMVYQEARLGK